MYINANTFFGALCVHTHTQTHAQTLVPNTVQVQSSSSDTPSFITITATTVYDQTTKKFNMRHS